MNNEPLYPDQTSYSPEQFFELVNDFLLKVDQNPSENQTETDQETQYQLHLEKAKILARFGCYQQALISIDQAIGLRPGSHPAWIFRGNMLLYLERYEAALTSFQQAIKIQPHHQGALFLCSVALYHLGQQKEAYLMYQQALAAGQQPIWKKLTQIFNSNLFRFHELI
jgi:tetratricopeptide (TPR) repeat protein